MSAYFIHRIKQTSQLNCKETTLSGHVAIVSNCNNVFSRQKIDMDCICHPHNLGDTISYIYHIAPTQRSPLHLLNPHCCLVGLLRRMHGKYFHQCQHHDCYFLLFWSFFVSASAASFVFIFLLPF